ncbi:hypothetical protein HK405_004357 [Cladochytrium tenue]|nr:hypothetical protein HK405_004357 [Cladochytrium tenue]
MPLRQAVLAAVPERRRRPLAICVCLAVAVAIIISSIVGIALLSRQVNNSVECWDADGILDLDVVDAQSRSAALCSTRNWRCSLVVDLREGRRFCSALCGDASAQIECAKDCGDHGCAACFTDGAARPARPEEAAASYRSWVCLASEGADAAVAGVAGGSDGDNFEDEEEVGPDGLSLGLDWWAKEARRCRETGRLYGECVCGECEIYLEAEREAE